MTLHRLTEARGASASETREAPEAETRSGAMSGWPSGYGLMDPAAIPPPGMGQMMRAGVPVTIHTSLQVDAVFTAVRVIVNAINKLGNLRAYETSLSADNIPYRVWQDKEPAILLNTFGPDAFQYVGRTQTVMSMALFGEAFWHVVDRDGLEYATTIDVLHPGFMKIERNSDGSIRYEYGPPNDRKVLPAADVVHIPLLSLPHSTRGLSGIEYGGPLFAIYLASMEYGQRFFSQGGSPGIVLTTDQKLGQADVERVAQKYLVEHSGLPNAHLPLVLDNGLKAQKVSAHPDEAQFLQTLEYARSAIASWFGIPSFLMPNALQRTTPEPPGVIQERTMSFLQYTLSGYITPLEEAHSFLIPQEQNAAFDTSRFTEPDAKSLAAEILTLRNSQVASVNDVRTRKLGWAPSTEDQADSVMTPLASNVAPEQTAPGSSGKPDPNPENAPDDEL